MRASISSLATAVILITTAPAAITNSIIMMIRVHPKATFVLYHGVSLLRTDRISSIPDSFIDCHVKLMFNIDYFANPDHDRTSYDIDVSYK
ncbi:hypothetical protein D3C75_1276830 [compost metagenome]